MIHSVKHATTNNGTNIAIGVFWGILAIGILLRLLGISSSPGHWQDEVQIVEYGRGIIDAPSDLLVYTPVQGAESVGPIWRVGLFAQELSCRVFGHVGARIPPLIYLLVSTILLRYIVVRRTNAQWMATITALSWFCCATLVKSVSAGRLDSLVFMLLWATLVVLSSEWAERKPCVSFAVAGCLSALCVFSWATAILLAPLFVWGMIDYSSRQDVQWRERIRPWIAYAVAGMAVSLIVLSPSLLHYDVMMQRLSFTASTHASGSSGAIMDFFREFRAFPYLYLLAIPCLFIRRRIDVLTIGAMIVIVLFACTRAYIFRVLYFLPYAFLSFVTLYAESKATSARKVLLVVLTCLASISFLRVALCKNIFAYALRGANDEVMLENALNQAIGTDANIYVADYSVYFAGRKLGWHQYRTFHRSSTPFDLPPEIVGKVDWFIGSAEQARKYDQKLREAGFAECASIEQQRFPQWVESKWFKCMWRFCLAVEHPYGPYSIWRKVERGGNE